MADISGMTPPVKFALIIGLSLIICTAIAFGASIYMAKEYTEFMANLFEKFRF
jgi:hypothetical protein